MRHIDNFYERTAGTHLGSHLSSAGWDLATFLTSAKTYLTTIGGGAISLAGLAGLIWGGILLFKKLMSGQQDQTAWSKIILLIILGGAFLTGGIVLLTKIGSGGQTTITQLGGGFIFF